MVKIYNTIDKVNGDPQRLSVLVELIWDKVTQPIAIHIDEEKMCDGPVRIICDNLGYWEADIQANDAIIPDSFYRITHYREDNPDNKVSYTIYVEDGTDPIWTGSALTTPPEWYADYEEGWLNL